MPLTSLPFRWRLGFALVLLLPALGWLVLAQLVPDEAALARQLTAQLERQFGVPVTIESLHWRLLPRPLVRIHQLRTGQAQPLQIESLRAWPSLGALLQGQVVLERLAIDGAVVPQASLQALVGAAAPAAPGSGVALSRVQFSNLVWIPRHGPQLPLEGELRLDADGLPASATVQRGDADPALRLRMQRTATTTPGGSWLTTVDAGGGTATGTLVLAAADGGGLRLHGSLEVVGVGVEPALAALGRKAPLQGRASGTTTLEARAAGVAGLLPALRSSTRFRIDNTVLLGIDLAGAARSAGRNTAGQTPLERVTGQLDTQNTPAGMVSRYTAVEAHSGVLTATGQATLAQGRIEGRFAIDLVDGLVGVPLRIDGPTASPQVSVPGAAVAGAVVGTAILPGVGTAVGARVGAALDQIFGGGDKRSPAPVASAPAKR